MDENGNIHLKRAHGFVNDFNWIIQAGLRCNHDIKYIGKNVNSSLAIVYYLTNYITKNGVSTYNQLLFALMAFQNNQKYESDNTDINFKAKRLMNSCFNSASNNTEYSGAMAAQLLLSHGKDGTYYSSHETTVLNLHGYLKEIKTSAITDDDLISTSNIYTDLGINKIFNPMKYHYEMRNKSLNDISLYDFISNYKNHKQTFDKKGVKIGSTKNCNKVAHLKEHLQFNTHELRQYKEKKIPIVIGPSFPRKGDSQNAELYAQMILTMFKPWRNLKMLKNNNETWTRSLHIFLKTASKESLEFIENIEFNVKAQNDAEEEMYELKKKKSTNNSEHEIYDDSLEDCNENPEFQNLRDLYVEHPELLSIDIVDQIKNDDHLKKALDSLDHLNHLQNPIQSQTNKCIVKKHSIIEEQNIKHWKDVYNNVNRKNTEKKQQNQPSTILKNYIVTTSTIGQRCSTNEKMSMTNNNTIVDINNVSGSEISSLFNLNIKQNIVFKLFTDSLTIEENECTKRIVMAGEGGTGKSQVVNAVIDYFLKNNHLKELLVSAPTGSAASLIHGKN